MKKMHLNFQLLADTPCFGEGFGDGFTACFANCFVTCFAFSMSMCLEVSTCFTLDLTLVTFFFFDMMKESWINR